MIIGTQGTSYTHFKMEKRHANCKTYTVKLDSLGVYFIAYFMSIAEYQVKSSVKVRRRFIYTVT